MTRRTDAVINLDDLFASGMDLADEAAVRRAAARLTEIEPHLAGFLDRELVQVAGKLALAGAPPPVCREATTMVLSLVITTFAAQRRASNRLWSDAMAGTPLADLVSPVPPPSDDDEQKLPFE